MISNEQIAHDLAMAYVNNRHGAEVSGDFSVETSGDNVSGSGTVATSRLPDVDAIRMIKVGTGEKYFFGLIERTEEVEAGFAVTRTFEKMIQDYHSAYARFLELLEQK
ncbi:hypothetical protein [Blastococcus sp. CCUG 61487]|uniref:hypothetical protein n=1 Tax=Blastococcus sp. CCUG 61487 TaxID=1840703 RepID=UPI0010BFD7CF|nr:hypothetical protein [Blastococcus sp. CCUG 61487]TKJ30283.1 hypothetical protein A6V29_18970 [Blastococcus sp. CCUG 61487]